MKKFVERILGRPDEPAAGSDTVAAASVKAFLPPGRRVYCIGDIHGRLDLLRELRAMIASDAASCAGARTVV